MHLKPSSDIIFFNSDALYFSRPPNPIFAYPGGEHISMLLYPSDAICLSVPGKSFSIDSRTIQLWKPIASFAIPIFIGAARSKPGVRTEALATAAALFIINDLREIGFIVLDSG